jgi:hypothetical protein
MLRPLRDSALTARNAATRATPDCGPAVTHGCGCAWDLRLLAQGTCADADQLVGEQEA